MTETSETHLSELAFASLDLVPSVAQGIRDAGFVRATPVQAMTLPIALTGKDVAGQAQTGTGKTAAFLVALYQRLLTNPPAAGRSSSGIRALILAPTRELAVQIFNDAEVLGKHTGLKIGVVYGGVDYEKQRKSLQDGIDVLIGTPGRVIDYFKQHVFDMRHAQAVVLDEADRMFDLGFIADIRFILRRLPKPEARQSMLFSATLSQRVLELAYEHMNNPELVRIEPDRITADKVRQMIYFPAMVEKVPLLIGLLRQYEARRTMVFVNTKRVAEKLEGYLIANGFKAQALSGDVPQKKRLRFMKEFHSGELAVLICTDVASRGLHIADVSHVFNYDLPQDAADYVHRIGRTARAGAEGDAISFGCEEYAVALPEIEAYITHKIPVSPVKPELLARDLKPPVYKEWDPADGPKPMRRSGGSGGGRGGPRRGGPGGGGGRGGPPRRSGGGGGGGGRGGPRRGGR
jgi:ATP-dependent RNA helicase RhlB